MRVIIDTSPLQYLHIARHLPLLEQLYGTLVVPRAVAEELDVGRQQGFDVPDCGAFSWMQLEAVTVPELLRLVTNLGRGEAEALALALDPPADLVLLDDAFARHVAASQGIRYTGTLGVLLHAKERQLIPAVRPLIDTIQEAGFRLSTQTKLAVLKLAREI
jgi:hypothetical protein